jgi:hypothetical protein
MGLILLFASMLITMCLLSFVFGVKISLCSFDTCWCIIVANQHKQAHNGGAKRAQNGGSSVDLLVELENYNKLKDRFR